MSVEPAPSAGVPPPGTVVADKYRIERVVGVGGMGAVVLAHHLRLEEPIAIKFLLPAFAQDGEAVARFLREARSAAKIHSEHVGRVFDVDVLPDTGAPYIVMEYLEGLDLAALLQRDGPLAVQRAVDLVLQCCEALAVAHACGIVHRDLKPSNLFLSARADGSPCIKVLDFGIAKIVRREAPVVDLTRTEAILGTPAYMSPEQLRDSR